MLPADRGSDRRSVEKRYLKVKSGHLIPDRQVRSLRSSGALRELALGRYDRQYDAHRDYARSGPFGQRRFGCRTQN
jgi:hypothetical protein